MPVVAKDDIILELPSEINFIQGDSRTYEFTLYKDFVGVPLNLYEPTAYHIAIFRNDVKYLQYSQPSVTGISYELNVFKSEGEGKISFTMTPSQSLMIPPGEIFAQVTVMYENFYPQPKVYVFPMIRLGDAIAGTGGVPAPETNGGNTGTPSTGGGTGEGTGGSSSVVDLSIYNIQAVDGALPTSTGVVTLDSTYPEEVTKIVFSNLTDKGIRNTLLENFLVNRISTDGASGAITLAYTDDSNFYTIYKINDWRRVDLNLINGSSEDVDAIEIDVTLESKSRGTGVTKHAFIAGESVRYSLDAYGIGGSQINDKIENLLPDQLSTEIRKYLGVFVMDKNINPTSSTGDSYATGLTISKTPFNDAEVIVEVNGISAKVGDGIKTTAAYFSNDGGNSALLIKDIVAGAELYWNSSRAGFDLEIQDEINFIYEIHVNDLNA